MAGSPADAISQAVERTKQLLFPFKAEKWFALGFTVFLAKCSEGGGGSFQVPSLPSGGSSGTGSSGGLPTDLRVMLDDALRALRDDLALYVLLGVGGALLLFGSWLFVAWFSSRAKLMFVESVIWDRVDVGAQWSRAAELGMSLFKCRVALAGSMWLLSLGSIAAAFVVGLPDFQAGQLLGTRALIAYSLLGGVLLFLWLPFGIALALLDDFVVPLMVVRNVRVGPAWSMFRAEVASGNLGGLALFYLLRVVLGLAIGILAGLLTCLTCCLAAVPYLGTVLLLPVWVFSRAFPLHYLEQLGVRIFPAPEPSWAMYDQWRFPR
ncbi:MAG TPA: hypothetical protein VIW29_00125 [Polyangiaceae bacterium]